MKMNKKNKKKNKKKKPEKKRGWMKRREYLLINLLELSIYHFVFLLQKHQKSVAIY